MDPQRDHRRIPSNGAAFAIPLSPGSDPVLPTRSAFSGPEIKNARSFDTSLAYMLGALCAHTEVESAPSKLLSMSSLESDRIAVAGQQLAAYLEHPIAISTGLLNGKQLYRIRLSCPSLEKHYHEVTANNTRVPWEHLATEDERRMFMRGLFDQAGWVSNEEKGGIGVNKVKGYMLLLDVARVAESLDMIPLVSRRHLAQLRFFDRNDWQTFQAKVGFSLPRDNEILGGLCSRVHCTTEYTAHDYKQVQKGQELYGDHYQAIARFAAVPENTVRDWLIRGAQPRAYRRLMKLQEATVLMSDGLQISRLYRDEKLSSSEARASARRGVVG
jgi:hypothetical protein